MRIRKPAYYDAFQCLSGACPDTCCAGWEVCIDEDSLARYQALTGPLGEQIRAALVTDADGDVCFCVENGHCALQRADGLCTIQAQLGEKALCKVCDAHPRFTEEYGPFREMMLAASCPEAARLMLTAPAAPPFIETVSDEPDMDCDDVDPALLAILFPCRERVFTLLRDTALPLGERMASALLYAAQLQDELDMGQLEGLDTLEVPALCPPEGGIHRQDIALDAFRLLSTLEILTETWRSTLSDAVTALESLQTAEYTARRRDFIRHMAQRGGEYENLALYFVARRFLAADFDADVYGKVSFAALSLLVLEELGALALARNGRFTVEDQIRLVGLWCKEQEHCDENLDALGKAAYDEDFFQPQVLGYALVSC